MALDNEMKRTTWRDGAMGGLARAVQKGKGSCIYSLRMRERVFSVNKVSTVGDGI